MCHVAVWCGTSGEAAPDQYLASLPLILMAKVTEIQLQLQSGQFEHRKKQTNTYTHTHTHTRTHITQFTHIQQVTYNVSMRIWRTGALEKELWIVSLAGAPGVVGILFLRSWRRLLPVIILLVQIVLVNTCSVWKYLQLHWISAHAGHKREPRGISAGLCIACTKVSSIVKYVQFLPVKDGFGESST